MTPARPEPPAPTHPAITRLAAAARVHDVDWHGRRIRWRGFGDGPPLVLLHGGHGSWLHWLRNIDVLADRHALWLPDQPGFGDSDNLDGPPHAPDRLSRLVEALAGSLDRLLGAATVVDLGGFSFGGLVAGELAAARGRIRRLALLGPAGHGGARRPGADLVDWRRDDPIAMQEGLRHNLAAFMLHDPAAIDDVAMAIHEDACRRTRFRSKALSRGPGLAATLARRPVPTLLVWGEHDVTADPHAVGPALAASHPDCRWQVVPGAGHWVQFEQADAVNRALPAWFAPDPPMMQPLPPTSAPVAPRAGR